MATDIPLYCQHGVVLRTIPGPIPAPGLPTAAWLNEHLPLDVYAELAPKKCESCAAIFREHGENTHVSVSRQVDGQRKNWLFPEEA